MDYYNEKHVMNVVNLLLNHEINRYEACEKIMIKKMPIDLKTYADCEKEANAFASSHLRAVKGLLSSDYEVGYEEGIQHYLMAKNNCNE